MHENPPRPRVLLVDDYELMLAALDRLLAPAFDVVGRVTDGGALLDEASRLRPDVIVLDVYLPTLSGLEACGRLKAALPQTAIVLMTADDDAPIREQARERGAAAFVPKYRLADELIPAIERALGVTPSPSA